MTNKQMKKFICPLTRYKCLGNKCPKCVVQYKNFEECQGFNIIESVTMGCVIAKSYCVYDIYNQRDCRKCEHVQYKCSLMMEN